LIGAPVGFPNPLDSGWKIGICNNLALSEPILTPIVWTPVLSAFDVFAISDANLATKLLGCFTPVRMPAPPATR